MPGSRFGNTLYAEFQTGSQGVKENIDFAQPDFYEYYENDADPWQMVNKYSGLESAKKVDLAAQLHRFLDCAGASCP